MSRDFTEMVEEHTKNKFNQTKESKEAMMFLKQKMDAAQGFIDAIKQRQNTLMTTMQAIIDLQRPFFLEGDESLLKPMILKECIDGEDKKKPLTDDELAEILKEKGYPIARRTVAKYRQQLNIPVARLRK